MTTAAVGAAAPQPATPPATSPAAGAPAPVAATPTTDPLIQLLADNQRQLAGQAAELATLRAAANTHAAPTTDDGEDHGMSTFAKVAMGIAALLFLLVATLVLVGGGLWAYNHFSKGTVASGPSAGQKAIAAEVGNGGTSVATPVANGEHSGREFVKTQNGFGLLCFTGSRQICWFNQSDQIEPTVPPGTKVLKVGQVELQRHGIGPTTPKAREEWAELGSNSWTYVAVPTATAASWRSL